MAGHFGVLHEVWAVWHAVVDGRRRETSTAQSKRVVVVVAFDAVTSCSGSVSRAAHERGRRSPHLQPPHELPHQLAMNAIVSASASPETERCERQSWGRDGGRWWCLAHHAPTSRHDSSRVSRVAARDEARFIA